MYICTGLFIRFSGRQTGRYTPYTQTERHKYEFKPQGNRTQDSKVHTSLRSCNNLYQPNLFLITCLIYLIFLSGTGPSFSLSIHSLQAGLVTPSASSITWCMRNYLLCGNASGLYFGVTGAPGCSPPRLRLETQIF